jgi:hypothetical protein
MTCQILKKWEENKVFEFQKSDIYNPAFGIGSADHDPYPDRKPHEIVERRVIGNEFFIEGEHISETPLEMGMNLVVDDIKYTVVSLEQDIGITTSDIKSAFVASHVEQFVEPLQLLETIRKEKLGPH